VEFSESDKMFGLNIMMKIGKRVVDIVNTF